MNYLIKIVVFLFLIASIVPAQNNQCQAITKKGTQCKRMAKAGSVFCGQHSKMTNVNTVKSQPPTEIRMKPQRKEIRSGKPNQVTNGQCQALTKKGKPCSRKVKAGSKYCWQHGG
jgi:hypothetical protein